jgi:aspartyl-tRNA(Asn)/glutamyl-tRNA(Gln) amidotransferase subunit C
MNIDTNTVARLAELAKLELDEKDTLEMVKDLNNMLQFVEQLNQINTDGVEPLLFVHQGVNNLREDHATSEITQQEALLNAPQKDMYYFRVPKVIQQ